MSKNILIIEDEKSIQNILKAFLKDAGYNVFLADDGLEGISTFHKAAYDLVLLDIMMPKVDGFTVCEVIRKESKTPVILLTALEDEAHRNVMKLSGGQQQRVAIVTHSSELAKQADAIFQLKHGVIQILKHLMRDSD